MSAPPRLAAPPRRLPRWQRLSILVGDPWTAFGFGWLLFHGLVLAFALRPFEDVTSIQLAALAETTQGEILCASPADGPGRRFVEFRYRVGERELEGRSFVGDGALVPGGPVVVEHSRVRPTIARVRGMRARELPPLGWHLAVALAWSTMGLALSVPALRRGVRALRTMREGTIDADGKALRVAGASAPVLPLDDLPGRATLDGVGGFETGGRGNALAFLAVVGALAVPLALALSVLSAPPGPTRSIGAPSTCVKLE